MEEKILEKATESKGMRKRDKIKAHISKKQFWQITTVVFAIMFIWAAFTVYYNVGENYPNAEVVEANTLKFIESEMVSPGVVIDVVNFTDEGCLYKMNLNLEYEGTVQEVESYVSMSGNLFFPQAVEITETPVEPNGGSDDGIKNPFLESDEEVCLNEDGLPIVNVFSTTWCPHCTWVKDTVDSVLMEYAEQGLIEAHHWEVDIMDDILTEEVETEVPAEFMESYTKYSGGSIPAFVFGCKYYRVGNSFESTDDLVAEEAYFRETIDKLLA